MKYFVSFVIPAYNSEKTIGMCLESIKKQKYRKEIILVDGGSRDKTQLIAEKHGARVIVERKRGPAAARNRGLEKAKGNLVAFIDADVVLPKKWLGRAVKKLEKNRKIAGVGGPGISVEKNHITKSLDGLLFGKPKTVKDRYVTSLATMNVLFKRSALGNQKFNESLITAEDPEFNFRLIKKGYMLLYSRTLFVRHYHPTSMKALLKRWYNYGKNYPKPYLKHREIRGPGFFARMVYIPMLIAFLLLSLLNIAFLFIAVLQILLLFFTYLCIGIRVTSGKTIILFPFIHTIKQLAQLTGIFVCFLTYRKTD